MKRSITSITSVLTALIMAATLLTGCRHKGLLFDEDPEAARVRVVFDWSKASDANPASMALYLYSRDGGAPLRYIFDNRDGGYIYVPYGYYDAIALNADNSDWAYLNNTSARETFEIQTSIHHELDELAPTEPETGQTEHIVSTPGMLWTAADSLFNIVPKAGEQVITLHPDEAVCHYTIDILDVDNIEALSQYTMIATISGLAESHIPLPHSGADTQAAHPISCPPDIDNHSLHSEFLTFGESPNVYKSNLLHIHTFRDTPSRAAVSRAQEEEADSTHRVYEFDVSDQAHNAPDPRHVHIVIHGLSVPRNVGSSAGLRPVVEDWIEEHINLDM